jgi:hypothetical protein
MRQTWQSHAGLTLEVENDCASVAYRALRPVMIVRSVGLQLICTGRVSSSSNRQSSPTRITPRHPRAGTTWTLADE